jgi:hypothetical protein
MGISVIGYALWRDGEQPEISCVLSDPAEGGLDFVADVWAQADRVWGFNSASFDDWLMWANGVEVSTTHDLLEIVRCAAGWSADYRSVPKGFSYSLDAIAKANGMAKTGHGALAPVLWQQGKHQEVVDYCRNDVVITYEVLQLGLKGVLIDPNTDKILSFEGLV